MSLSIEINKTKTSWAVVIFIEQNKAVIEETYLDINEIHNKILRKPIDSIIIISSEYKIIYNKKLNPKIITYLKYDSVNPQKSEIKCNINLIFSFPVTVGKLFKSILSAVEGLEKEKIKKIIN